MDAENNKKNKRADMSTWQDLTLEERMVILQNVAKTEKIPQAAIEKDWWVTAVLKAVFQTEASCKMLFKGGTSLSKGWHLIERLSEDVDLAVDHSFFGINGTNKNQRDKLRKLSRRYIQDTLSKSLEYNLTAMGCRGFSVENVTLKPNGEPLDSDVDPTVILVNYESICEGTMEYIQPRVKIEISCLSMSEPFEEKEIESLIYKNYPSEDDSTKCRVRTVLPSRTFLEKAFLLNEEFQKDKPRSQRMSRHLYDLYMMMDTEFGKAALADTDLYEAIIAHRHSYYAVKYIDYQKLLPASIDFRPPQAVCEDWKSDYEKMMEYFIYGNAPSFEQLSNAMDELVGRFHNIKLRKEE